MKKKNNFIFAIISVFVTMCILLIINYVAVTCFIGKLELFTILVLVVPMLCVAAVSFIIGYRIKWKWKRGILIALVLTLISWGTSRLTVFMAGNRLNSVGEAETWDNSLNTSNDELMDELYNELDKKAYEYMLEQGLISEGEEIFSDDKTADSKDFGDKKEDVNNDEIASSKMYMGVQKSDPVTEVIGNIITFLIAYGLSFFGYQISKKNGIKNVM